MRKLILALGLMTILTGCQSEGCRTNGVAFDKIIKAKKSMPEVELVVESVSLPDESLSDKEIIAKVVNAEAGNQDMIGKRLVADCVLNRVSSSEFPKNIQDVCTQHGQFVISNKYTEEDMLAVEMEWQERLDYEAVFFRTNHYHSFGTPLYQHGDHYFSKK